MDTFIKLDNLYSLAKQNEKLRKSLADTENSPEPLADFCKIAQTHGVDITLGELFAVGLEYSDNQCKSTNGGNPSPYEAFDDTYETFISSIKKIL